jgi:hypothetical protein
MNSELAAYLKGVGYVPISKMVHSSVYCQKSKAKGEAEVLIDW